LITLKCHSVTIVVQQTGLYKISNTVTVL